ncbi:MAG: thiamine pyrophosphate-dependent enzyme, partial [Marinirhabdus sp.]|nr:thiamine pyrophosphate-dependent enzyme [Marinirhabdus sp.]
SSLDDEDRKVLQPDILLTFGGMIVSKRIKAFLRKYQPQTHWHIDPKKAYDTFFALSFHYKNTSNAFLAKLQQNVSHIKSDYRDRWLRVKAHRLERHAVYEQQIPFSDFKAFAHIFKNLPPTTNLQLANSATVRYAQLFDFDAGTKVFCNRGTSGIDGSTSTAIGAAYASDTPTVLVTGDLSFFYDSNALWNSYIPNSFRIIIVNNSGGGIFRILPGAKDAEHFKTYFETRHSLTAAPLASMFGFEYESATTEVELSQGLSRFFEPSKAPKILEIFTPSDVNDRILLEYFSFIA